MTEKNVKEDLMIDSTIQLLNTIKVPVNLHYLTDRLPEPNYNPLSTRRSYNADYVKKIKPIKSRPINHKRSKSNIMNDRGKKYIV